MIDLMPKFQTQFETPEDSPGFMLWRVSNLWQRHIRAALEPLGLTHVQFVLLASLGWLTQHNQPISQVQLANHIEIDVMMTSQVLRTLEAKGLVRRSPSPTDKRAFELSLSNEGLVVANQATQLVEQADKEFFSGLTSKSFVESLKQLVR